jgi:hypothetical protein
MPRLRVLTLADALVLSLTGQTFASAQDSTPGAATPIAGGSTDGPMYRGNPARISEMAGPGPAGQPVKLWRVQLGGPAFRSPAISGGVVDAGSGDGHLHAIDTATRQGRWQT